MMILISCTSFNGAPGGIVLPAMPVDLTAPCTDPGVRKGQDVRIELARNRVALSSCREKHRDTVDFYKDVEKEFKK